MKGKSKYRKHVRWLVLAIVCGIIMLILFLLDGIILGMGITPTVNSYLHADFYKKVNPTDDVYYRSEYATEKELADEEQSVCLQLEEEGAALLKNDGALPLGEGAGVSLFSASSYDFIYGGTGSGEVNTDNAMTLQESLEKSGFKVNRILADVYEKAGFHRATPRTTGGSSSDYLINELPVDKYLSSNPAVKDSFGSYGDAAIVTFSRSGGEGSDLPYGDGVTGCEEGGPDSRNGDYLILNEDELELLSFLKGYKDLGVFKSIIVLVNSSNALQLDFAENAAYGIDAVLWTGDVGQSGIEAIGEILSGAVNPSGRIADTFLADNHSSPAMQNFGVYEYSNAKELGLESAQNNMNSGITKLNSRYVVYEEGIYVGYKYYETRYEDCVMGDGNTDGYEYGADVAYPFGSGLSYLDDAGDGYTGSWEYRNISKDETEDEITISLDVYNGTGVAGKHTVQIYMQSPYTDYDKTYGVEKASVELAGFAKTGSVRPGKTDRVSVTISKSQMAAYDSAGAGTYIVDPGTYYFTVASDAHQAVNNILAAKLADGTLEDADGSIAARMDDHGNADYVRISEISLDTDNCDSTASVNLTYSISGATGAAITNKFSNADINSYTTTNAVTYLTRHDWKGTFPKACTGLAATERMWEDGLASDDSSLGPDGKTKGSDARAALVSTAKETFKEYYEEKYGTLISEVPAMEQEGDLQLWNLTAAEKDADGNYTGISSDWNDPRWNALLSQASYADMTGLIYNGFRQTLATDSIGLPGTTDYNGPQGLTNAITNGESGMAYTSEDVMAATFSLDLVERMGKCIGEDFLAAGIAGIYGPGGNIHRTPYSGRNFEYYSEDGWLGGAIAKTEVQAISSKGVMVFMKHCVLNDQENGRYGLSTFANEQSIREIYLKPFEAAAKTGNGAGVMTSFNRIGVTWSGADFDFLTGVLREEFGMDGISITDCTMFATPMDYRLGVLAGQNIWDSMSLGVAQLDGLENDAVMVTAVREAVKHIAYTVSGSLAMNNIGEGTTIKTIMPAWAITILAVGIAFTLLMLLFIFFYLRSCLKAMRSRIKDGVDKKGRPVRKQRQTTVPAA
ncbi:MAG: glycoside hydrolase family 3 C-terminal domain-containing protein [Clostridia bacterium]|nr:glycoside hydrolase family 3 C-terminal domain-containing protein [Clostridia bacterium]